MKRWLLLALAVIAEVSGSLSMKLALDAPALYLVTAAGYIVAFAALAATLRAGMALGAAYGIWGACGVALTALFSHLLFAEPLTPVMLLGMGLIIAGVLLVEFGSQLAAARQGAAPAPRGRSGA